MPTRCCGTCIPGAGIMAEAPDPEAGNPLPRITTGAPLLMTAPPLAPGSCFTPPSPPAPLPWPDGPPMPAAGWPLRMAPAGMGCPPGPMTMPPGGGAPIPIIPPWGGMCPYPMAGAPRPPSARPAA